MTDFPCRGCGALIHKTWTGRDPKWCSERCRKASYGDPCIDCGARTSYGSETARIPEPRCPACAYAHYRKWTRELVIDRMREWAALYGEQPAAPDWRPYQAAHQMNDPERAARFNAADGHWPAYETVSRLFGTWTAAIIAVGRGLRHDSRRQRQRRPSLTGPAPTRRHLAPACRQRAPARQTGDRVGAPVVA